MTITVEQKKKYSKANKLCYRKKIVIFAVVALFTASYSILWSIMADRIQKWFQANLLLLKQRDITANCENPHKTGYPLRIAIACDALTWSGPFPGFSFASHFFAASSSIYAPDRISVYITAPVTLEISDLRPIKGEWKDLRIDAGFDIRQINNTSLALSVDRLQIFNMMKTGLEKSVEADFFRMDTRIRNDDTLTIRLSFEQLLLLFAIKKTGRDIPVLNGSVELALDKTALSAWKENNIPVSGYSGNLLAASLAIAGGQLTFSGPLSISPEGLLNGQVTVAVSNHGAIINTMRNLFPEWENKLDILFFMLNNISKNKKDTPQLVFDIADNKIRMGFIKIGTVPPLIRQ